MWLIIPIYIRLIKKKKQKELKNGRRYVWNGILEIVLLNFVLYDTILLLFLFKFINVYYFYTIVYVLKITELIIIRFVIIIFACISKYNKNYK